MNTSYLSQSDWTYFENTYPEAAAYLLRASLIGEWECLLGIPPQCLNDWQTKRLAELNTLFNKTV